MDRRSFIRVIGLGVASATLTSTLSGCSADSEKVDYGWSGPKEKSIGYSAIAIARLCHP